MFCFFLFIVFPLPSFFFFTYTATTEIYTLSLHDALPIYPPNFMIDGRPRDITFPESLYFSLVDRKSTRLNSSHLVISYAVFCLKKKKKQNYNDKLKYKPKNEHIKKIHTKTHLQ